MKTYVDLFETYKGIFLTHKKFKSRLLKYWGTEIVDGVEVLREKVDVWPGTEERPGVPQLLQMFGLYKSIKEGNFDGITSYYLYFNPHKTTISTMYQADVLANKLNTFLPLNQKFVVNLNFTNVADPSTFIGFTPTDIYNYVDANYSTLIDSIYFEARGDTLAKETVGAYILLDDGAHFNVEVQMAMVVPVSTPVSFDNTNSLYNAYNSYAAGITLQLVVSRKNTVLANSAIIQGMLNENTEFRQRQLALLNEASVDSEQTIGIPTSNRVTDEFWYDNRVRVAAFDSLYLDRDVFMKTILATLDTGYTKKKTGWFKKIISIVIAVVVTVIAFYVSGPGGAAAAFGATTAAAVMAFTLGLATLMLTLVQFAIAYSGDGAMAMYFGRLVNMFSKVSMVVGVYAFIQSASQNAFLKGLQESFEKGGVMAAAKYVGEVAMAKIQTAATSLVENMVKLVTPASVTDILPTLGEIGNNKIVSIGSTVAQKVIDMRVASLKADITELEGRVQQSNKELNELTDREVHIAATDIKVYTKPLTMDNLPFEVDYLYEGTLYNIGRPSFVPTGMNIRDKG